MYKAPQSINKKKEVPGLISSRAKTLPAHSAHDGPHKYNVFFFLINLLA